MTGGDATVKVMLLLTWPATVTTTGPVVAPVGITIDTLDRILAYIAAATPGGLPPPRGLVVPPEKRDPRGNFRFFENRQKYLLFVHTCSEKRVIADRVALELASIIERWIGPLRMRQPTVNVEYRDAEGVLMDLGPFIHAVLRNGRGKANSVNEGVFVDCEPDWIKAGALVHISVQDSLVREELVVQVDLQREMLFVKSQLRIVDLVMRINNARHRGEAGSDPDGRAVLRA
jgi:hypothetical protein